MAFIRFLALSGLSSWTSSQFAPHRSARPGGDRGTVAARPPSARSDPGALRDLRLLDDHLLQDIGFRDVRVGRMPGRD